jgi:hypothetical protein
MMEACRTHSALVQVEIAIITAVLVLLLGSQVPAEGGRPIYGAVRVAVGAGYPNNADQSAAFLHISGIRVP